MEYWKVFFIIAGLIFKFKFNSNIDDENGPNVNLPSNPQPPNMTKNVFQNFEIYITFLKNFLYSALLFSPWKF